MTGDGRPLRFLLLVMTGWVGARAVMLWPEAPVALAREAIVPVAAAASRSADAIRFVDRPPARPVFLVPVASPVAATRGVTRVSIVPPSIAPLASSGPAAGAVPPQASGIVAGLPVAAPPVEAKPRSRFFGSAWAVARGGSGPPGGVPGVQLGGSQAGVRIGYALRADRRLALVGRVSSPLGRGLREGALGIEWQPTRLPVRLVAEQRFALGAGRGGPTLAAVGGIGPAPLALGFRLEAYAQGGVIARDGAEGFADGALRIARPVARFGGVKIDLGGGAWGAAQRGARRLDVGPSLSAVLPIGPQPVRLSVDWRQRVGGNASPGSGAVVTLGADF